MLARAALLLITLFWIGMNVLLWQAEYGESHRVGSAIPVGVVWQKILTAPDSSSLSIFYHGKKVGFCHWFTSVGAELTKLKETDTPPEGMVERVSGYAIQWEGNLVMEDFASRVRFDGGLKLGTNELWQEFNLRLNLRPTMLEIHSLAAEQTLRVRAEGGDGGFSRVIKFSELQDPQALLAELGGPLAIGMFGGLAEPGSLRAGAGLGAAMKWEARNDSLKIGHASVGGYRLEARLLDRHKAVILVSRVGEILRVELPDGIVLVNDQVAGL